MTVYKNKGLFFGGVLDDEGIEMRLSASFYHFFMFVFLSCPYEVFLSFIYHLVLSFHLPSYHTNLPLSLPPFLKPSLPLTLLLSLPLTLPPSLSLTGPQHTMTSCFYNDMFAFDMERKRWYQLGLKVPKSKSDGTKKVKKLKTDADNEVSD